MLVTIIIFVIIFIIISIGLSSSKSNDVSKRNSNNHNFDNDFYNDNEESFSNHSKRRNDYMNSDLDIDKGFDSPYSQDNEFFLASMQNDDDSGDFDNYLDR